MQPPLGPPGSGYGPPPPQSYWAQQQPPVGPPSQGGGAAPASYPGYQPQAPYSGQMGAYGAPHGPPGGGQVPHVSSYPGPMAQPGYAPAPFVPSQPQYAYQPPPPGPPQMPAAPMAGASFMGGLSPMTLMTAGGLLSAPQQYMQQRVSWLKTNMTGGTMSALFNISNSYVRSKLLMLLLPFLGRWTYARSHEQVAGGQRWRAPAGDVNAPDLYLPLMAVWAYALLTCAAAAARGAFKPDAMSSALYSACFAWAAHWLLARLLLRGVGAGGVPWAELAAYTGYPFLAVSAATAAGALGGRPGYYAVGAYGALASAVFLVKTMKRVIFLETRSYGADVRTSNYLLLGLALFQFPFMWWMAARPV
ncbi:yif1b-a [Scenedesmus sp. PABB004]|nr:yif1b-a [Scenedesmus sp. PABB004]